MPAKETKERRATRLKAEANQRYIAKKAARQREAAMEAALAPIVPPKPPVGDEHPTLGGQAPALMPTFENPPFSSDEFEEDDGFSEYAPPPGAMPVVAGGPDEHAGVGVDWQDVTGKSPDDLLDQAFAEGGESTGMPVLLNSTPLEGVQPEVVALSPTSTPKARQQPSEALGEGEPADPDELPPLIHGGDEAAQVVLNLIDGLEYLFKKAKGLKMHDKPILMRRVKAGRELINLLKRQ